MTGRRTVRVDMTAGNYKEQLETALIDCLTNDRWLELYDGTGVYPSQYWSPDQLRRQYEATEGRSNDEGRDSGSGTEERGG